MHQFVVKLIAVTSLNRMWQGPRAFQTILHRFMIIPMFHISDFGVPLVSLLPCPFFVGLGGWVSLGFPVGLVLLVLGWPPHTLLFFRGRVCVWTISKDVKLVTHNGQDPYPFLLPFLWSGITVLQNWAGPLPSL